MTATPDIKVLLVDDESDFRGAVARRLARRGIAVSEAGDGAAAIARMEAQQADVVVMDVKMPGMGGIQALSVMKLRWPETEVILLTGHAAMEDGLAGIKAGAFDYLTKPIEHEHLYTKISQAFELKTAAAARSREVEFRKRMESQMAVTERLASLGTLAAGVAHEINNPLAIIAESAGYAKLLLKKRESQEFAYLRQLTNALDKVEAAVLRAKNITHQLLGFARNAGDVVKETDLAAMAREVAALLNSEASSRKVALSVVSDQPKPVVWTNPDGIRQVMVNLAGNAIQASPPGQNVLIRISYGESEALISVEDRGTGIPAENLEKIFEPFYTTKPPGQGTGLGLFVSRSIIERLNGHIVVSSRVGEGSVFTVHIPRFCKEVSRVACDANWLETAMEMERRNGHGAGSH
ncbi:MAG: response regulator [Thermodesulfobacteriota bacterium]